MFNNIIVSLDFRNELSADEINVAAYRQRHYDVDVIVDFLDQVS